MCLSVHLYARTCVCLSPWMFIPVCVCLCMHMRTARYLGGCLPLFVFAGLCLCIRVSGVYGEPKKNSWDSAGKFKCRNGCPKRQNLLVGLRSTEISGLCDKWWTTVYYAGERCHGLSGLSAVPIGALVTVSVEISICYLLFDLFSAVFICMASVSHRILNATDDFILQRKKKKQ